MLHVADLWYRAAGHRFRPAPGGLSLTQLFDNVIFKEAGLCLLTTRSNVATGLPKALSYAAVVVVSLAQAGRAVWPIRDMLN
jgi:type VI protein secretion system component VasK